jgi:predicted  nucleic acid-binding Zn-ribbon protein
VRSGSVGLEQKERFMNTNHGSNRERYHDTKVDKGEAARRKEDPDELTSEIGVLQDQIAVLEDGLPRASGMERTALAKEINAYRERLEAAQHALGAID